MAKQTKRQRKFQVSGGVKGRIEKGTVTKGGKLRKRKVKESEPKQKRESVEPKQDKSDDLLGQENLGELDLDSFFATFADASEGLKVEEDEEKSESESSDDDDDDDDDDGDENGGLDEDIPEPKTAKKNTDTREESDSSDEDSNEDIEAAEAQMKKEMSKMKESDPEFHEFLQENETELLEFGEQEAKEEEEAQEKTASQHGIHLTSTVLSSLAKGTFKSHSTKSLKKLLGAYKSACYLADGTGEHRPGESAQNYIIDSSRVFDELMLLCMNRCHKEFAHHLLGDDGGDDGDDDVMDEDEKDSQEEQATKPLNPKTLEKSERWAEMRPILLSFFRSTLHVMAEAKEPELISFILKALGKYMRFLTPFPRIAEHMLKALTGLWSAPLDASENYQVVRLNAFFRMRQLALTQPFPFIEDVLKKTYLAYAKRAKFGSSVTNSPALPTLTFMGNCLVELYSLDFHSSYQHAFVYIRQLALLLRTAMQKKTPEAMQQVYCWQFVHCLKLWVAVLSSTAPADDGALMRSLIYPLTEVILGTVRFVPSPVRHLPLRFHCIRLLQQLAGCTQVFIPTTSLLLDCLDWKEWSISPKKSKTAKATRGVQMHLMIKLGKEDPLRSYEQLESGINEFFLLTNREIELYRYSAGFPEFAVRIVVRLRQFAKDARNPRWRTYAKACIEVCDKYSSYAVQARSKLNEAPKDVKLLECLKPVSEKTMKERHEASIEKEQKALEASRPPPSKKKPTNADSDDEDNSDEEPKQEAKPAKKTKKRKKSQQQAIGKEELERRMMGDDELMEEQDEVQEGINWSDDDE